MAGEEGRVSPPTEKRASGLAAEQAGSIDAQAAASGAYAAASAVVRARLRALQERDAAVERRLREEVVPVAAVEADPSRPTPMDEAVATIRAHRAERVKERGG
jgi:antitoxin ParD1/3/4